MQVVSINYFVDLTILDFLLGDLQRFEELLSL